MAITPFPLWTVSHALNWQHSKVQFNLGNHQKCHLPFKRPLESPNWARNHAWIIFIACELTVPASDQEKYIPAKKVCCMLSPLPKNSTEAEGRWPGRFYFLVIRTPTLKKLNVKLYIFILSENIKVKKIGVIITRKKLFNFLNEHWYYYLRLKFHFKLRNLCNEKF